MADELYFDGIRYVSASDASEDCDLHRDYISRLAREGKIRGKRVAKNWYIDPTSLKSFIVRQEYEKQLRKESLSHERTREYELANAEFWFNHDKKSVDPQ